MGKNNCCKKCGAILREDMAYCTNCGNEDVFEEKSGGALTGKSKSRKIKRSRTKGVSAGLVVVMIMMFSGRFLVDVFTRVNNSRDLEKHVERVENYAPGYIKENKYISTHFNLVFEADDYWEFYSIEEYRNRGKVIRESWIAETEKTTEGKRVSDELSSKKRESIYCKLDMGGTLNFYGDIVGEVEVVVCSFPGSEIDEEKYIKKLKKSLEEVDVNVSTGEKTLAGETWYTVERKLNGDTGDEKITMLIKEKGGMLCTITCRSFEGYGVDVANYFINQTNAY